MHQGEHDHKEHRRVHQQTVAGRAACLGDLEDGVGTHNGSHDRIHHGVCDGVGDDVVQETSEGGVLDFLHEHRREHLH